MLKLLISTRPENILPIANNVKNFYNTNMTQGFFQFNDSIINQILNFVTSSFDLLFMSGEKGTSKSEIMEKVSSNLSENNLVFTHFCFENTVIDDFLLNFYDALRSFSLASKISLKKFATNNFKEKVSHYFKTIDANCVIIIENFEKIDTNVEIVDFLSYLAGYKNVKIIICTRNKDRNLFRFKKIRMQTINLNQIEKNEFNSHLSILLGPVESEVKEKFYEITSGLELYLKMSIKYCNTTDTSIKDLIAEFERKNMSFEEFLVLKFTSLTPSAYQNIFKILCMLDHPVSINFLNAYKLGDISHIEYLEKNFLINTFGSEIYVKDYFRKHIVKTFSIQEKINYCKKLNSIYENELTKSPKDRLLRLSRESIRKEIDRFNSIMPNINSSKSQNSFSYIGFSQKHWHNKEDEQKSKLTEKLAKIKERKNFLAKEKDRIVFPKKSEILQKNEDKEISKRFIINLINSSRDLTKQYRYRESIKELLRAYDEDDSDEFKIEILTLIAKNNEHLNEYILAQKNYEEALEIANKTNDIRKCELQFLIAMTNKNLFKIDLAKEDFHQIAYNKSNPVSYRAKAYIELGEIEQADSKTDAAIKCYKNAVSLALGKSKELVCRCYYLLGVLYDENQQIEEAIQYYQKNYLTSSERYENKYYSASCVNLGLIYFEQSKYRQASEAFKLALLYDSENNDWENMYISQKELGKIYLIIDPTSAVGYFKQALDSAYKLNDIFKAALVYFEAGELQYDRGQDEKALECFFNAKEILKNDPNDENMSRINSRIKDIEVRLGSTTFNLIAEKYDKSK